MMVTCHSNTLASSTKPALNPSMGFRASSARSNAESAAACGRDSTGKARRTPRRKRSRARRGDRSAAATERARLSAACAAAGPPARSSGRRLCGTRASGAHSCLAERLAARRAAQRVAGGATTRCGGGASAACGGCCETRCREEGGRRRDASTLETARPHETYGQLPPAAFITRCLFSCGACRLDEASRRPAHHRAPFRSMFHPVQRAVSLPAPSLSPPVGRLAAFIGAPGGRHAGLFGSRVGVCAVCGGARPRQCAAA